MGGKMKEVEDGWRVRFQRQVTEVERLEARNRWLWSDLRASRSRVQQLEEYVASGAPQPRATRPAEQGTSWERRTETVIRIQALERQLNWSAARPNDFYAQTDSVDACLRALHWDRDELARANQELMGKLEEAREESAGLLRARTIFSDLSHHLKEQVKCLSAHGKEMEARAEAAEAEVTQLRAAEEKRSREKITAASKVEGMDVGDAYFLGFDECKMLANMLCPGIGKDLRYPLEEGLPLQHQAGRGGDGGGSSRGAIDLNGAP